MYFYKNMYVISRQFTRAPIKGTVHLPPTKKKNMNLVDVT